MGAGEADGVAVNVASSTSRLLLWARLPVVVRSVCALRGPEITSRRSRRCRRPVLSRLHHDRSAAPLVRARSRRSRRAKTSPTSRPRSSHLSRRRPPRGQMAPQPHVDSATRRPQDAPGGAAHGCARLVIGSRLPASASAALSSDPLVRPELRTHSPPGSLCFATRVPSELSLDRTCWTDLEGNRGNAPRVSSRPGRVAGRDDTRRRMSWSPRNGRR